MSKFKRSLIITASFLLLSMSCSISAFAATKDITKKNQLLYEVQPKADVIVTKYRIDPITLQPQYRRWNETQNRWVDPYWIDM